MHLQTFWATVLSFVSWKLLFTFSVFFHGSWQCIACSSLHEAVTSANGTRFDHCLLHQDCTRQNHVNLLLISKITEQDQTGSFFRVLPRGTGISLKCAVPSFAVLETRSCAGTPWPIRVVTLQSYIRVFWPSLCCMKTSEARDAIPAKYVVCWMNLPAALLGKGFCG